MVSKVRNLSLEGFVAYVEARPRKLGCWRDGSAGTYPTLAWLNVHPVVSQRSLMAEIGPVAAVALTTASSHNQVGIAAGWTIQHMRGRGRAAPTPEQDRLALWSTAAQYWALRNLIIEIRVGLRGFEATGTRIALPYKGNHDVDALDRILDLVDTLEALPDRPSLRDPLLAAWLRDSGRACPWEQAPGWVTDAYRSFADKILASYPRYLPPELTVAGFSIADLDAYWSELLARGGYMHCAIMLGSEHPPTVVPAYERDRFVEEMSSAAGIGADRGDRITTLLTLDRDVCPDPALTPLVPLENALVPMSSLIMPASPHRNTLAILQTRPEQYGETGRLLGIAGERTVLNTLKRLSPDMLVASRVKVLRPDGRVAGDLDVVICDPKDKLLAVFEIKWHIATDGNAEVYRMEQAAIDKRVQVLRLRAEIESGVVRVQWPPDWPDVSEVAWRWFVLTRDVLSTRHVTDEAVTLRSHQVIARTLRRGASVRDAIGLLDDPPLPPAALRATGWTRVRYGDLRIDFESIEA